MISRHPTTGKQIRILRSEATLSKNLKTCVWIEHSFQPSHRWSRWSTLLTDIRSLSVLQEQHPSIIIIKTAEDATAWSSWCKTHSDNSTILIGTKIAETILGESSFLSISELNNQYPFLKQTLTDESSLELIVNAVCHLFRFNQLVTSRTMSPLWKGVITNVLTDAKDSIVPQTYWISQYYEPAHPTRARELRECLDRNILCPFIDRILLLTEKDISVPSSEKIILHPFGKRPTYADTFKVAMELVPKGNNSILIFSNSDIWFDETLRALWSIQFQDKISLSLLRWEGDKIFGPRPDSQDTWILGRDAFDVRLEPFQFNYGVPGCDNIVSLELLKQKYLIVNPAYTIKTYHNHASSIRSYHARDDILYNSAYLYIDPTAIQPFGTTTSFGSSIASWNNSLRTFSREVGFLKTPLLTLSPYTPAVSPSLYHIERVDGLFVSPENLLYDFENIWMNDFYKVAWGNSTLHTLATTIHLPSMVAFAGTNVSNPAKWMVQTLPSIFRIQKRDPTVRFIIPPVLQPLLPEGIPYQSDVQYWSQSVWAVPSPLHIPTSEDIDLLRSYFKIESAPTNVPTIVFLLNDDLLPLHHAEQIYAMHCVHTVDCETTTRWNVRYVHPTDSIASIQTAFQQADWLVGSTDHMFFSWIWRMKPGSTVLEFQKEDSISEEIVHLAGASSLHYVIGIQRFREPVEDRRQQALIDVGIAIKKYGLHSRLKELTSGGSSSLPVITLPTDMTGIHVHSGDSFREMIQLWKERGYCKIEPSARSPFCWWGEIGETLLYDRDTMKWMEMDAPVYKLALIGNPSPTDKLRQSKWSYWPRYPHLVEVVHPRSWGERTIHSIFLGRIENGVQKKNRETHDWKRGVQLFICPIDSSGGAYKYSPSEYLEKLCHARFGLCLAGFGQKCHREIEYYACGTVPIATSACDMTGYLNPPIEGVHFLRASTPEEVHALVKSTSRLTWEKMSIAGRMWWKENASAEGLFRLTSNRIQQCLPYAGIAIP